MEVRHEINGLRAIAVIAVILYHADISIFGRPLFTGGFLGVDIFFVVSGYIISRLLLNELKEQGTINVLNFFERRARRILPALIIVGLVTLSFCWFYILPSSLVELSKSLLATLFFVSNIFFYMSSVAYGAEILQITPFLHSWSLGIEEQFYLLFPILLLVFRRAPKGFLLTIFLGLLFFSLQFAELISNKYPLLNFYMIFSRAWELTLGVLIAIIEVHYGWSKNRIAQHLMPISGLYLIAYSFIFFTDDMPMPGFQSLMPVIGTGFILIFASKDDLVGRVLSFRLFSGIGLVSYSAYLWHYPIFILSSFVISVATLTNSFLLILLTFFLSALSYFLIEQPFRNKAKINTKLFLTSIFLGVSSLIGATTAVIVNEGFPSRKLLVSSGGEFLPNYERDNKSLQKERDEIFEARKTYSSSDGSKPIVLLVGNSHAKDLFLSLVTQEALTSRYEFIISQDIQLACFDYKHETNLSVSEKVFSSEGYQDSHIIIAASRYYKDNRCNRRNMSEPISSDHKGLANLIHKSLSDGKKVIAFSNIPEFLGRNLLDDFVSKVTIKEKSAVGASKNPIELWKQKIDKFHFSNLKTSHVNKVNEEIRQVTDAFNVPYFEQGSVYCDYEVSTCHGITEEGEKIYIDYGHRTVAGSKYFGQLLAQSALVETLDNID